MTLGASPINKLKPKNDSQSNDSPNNPYFDVVLIKKKDKKV